MGRGTHANLIKTDLINDTEHHLFYPNEDKWPTAKEVAEQLGVSRETVTTWLRTGKMQGKMCHTPIRHWIVNPEAVAAVAP